MPGTLNDENQDYRQTPFGRLYRPKSVGMQIATFLGCLLAMLMQSSVGRLMSACLVAVTGIFWGYWLSFFAQRGYLPFPEDNG